MARIKRVIVHCMSGFVIAVGVILMLGMLGAMVRFPNAEVEVYIVADLGVGLFAIAATVIWRTLKVSVPWWEAAAQYTITGGLLATSFFRHAFYEEAVMYSQAHLIVSAVFCVWNLVWVYRARTRHEQEIR